MFSVYSVCFWPSAIVYNNIQKYAWPDINLKKILKLSHEGQQTCFQ